MVGFNFFRACFVRKESQICQKTISLILIIVDLGYCGISLNSDKTKVQIIPYRPIL